MSFERREECSVRAAVSQWDAEPLRVSEHDVGAQLSGRRQEREAQQVRTDRDEHAVALGRSHEIAQIPDLARFIRRLRDGAKHPVAELHVPDVAHDEFDAERLGARA